MSRQRPAHSAIVQIRAAAQSGRLPDGKSRAAAYRVAEAPVNLIGTGANVIKAQFVLRRYACRREQRV